MNHSSAKKGNSKWMRLVADASSSEIFRILKNEPIGNVHSMFDTSLNLIFGERIVHIGALENGMPPFGIGLDQNDACKLIKQVRAEESVVWKEHSNELFFEGGITISLECVESIHHTIRSQAYNRKILNENVDYICKALRDKEWQTGLAQTKDEKRVIIDYILSPDHLHKTHPALLEFDNLLLLAQGADSICADSVFDYWIGRGPGLTPSGDDVLTGLCAMQSTLVGSKRHVQKTLASYLRDYGQRRTTQIGLEYLLYAVKDEYHTHLVELSKITLKTKGMELKTILNELRKHGHTSGTDTLIGVLLGIKAMLIHQSNDR